jgi:hypothetical protein
MAVAEAAVPVDAIWPHDGSIVVGHREEIP